LRVYALKSYIFLRSDFLIFLTEALVTKECLLIGEAPNNLGKIVIKSCKVSLLIRGGVSHPVGKGCSELLIQANDHLIIACLAEAIPALRNVCGLTLRPDMDHHQTSNLVLVEAAVASGSPLVHLSVIEALKSPAFKGADVWAIRQRGKDRHDMLLKRQSNPVDRQGAGGKATMPQEEPTLHQDKTPQVPLSSLETVCQRVQQGTYMHEQTRQIWLKESSIMREVSNLGEISTGTSLQSADFSSKSAHSDGSDGISPQKRSLTNTRKKKNRHGERQLQAGDTLLVEAPASWVQAHRCTQYFAVLSQITEDTTGCDRSKVSSTIAKPKLAASIVALMCLLILSALDLVSLFPLALVLSFFLVSTGCITLDQAWGSIGYRTLLTVACSFGPGAALTNTHVSTIIGTGLIELRILGRFGFLLAIYLITSAFTCIVSNSATVVAFYSVLRLIQVPGVSAEQMMITMLLGASSAFAAPIGYQTNLMVLGRGGYAFSDFIALGGGLTIVTGVCVSGISLLVL